MNFVSLPPTFALARHGGGDGDDTISMSASEVEPWTVKEVLELADDECKSLWDNLDLSYASFKGHPLLLAEVAKLYGLQPKDVLLIAPQEGIYIALTCLVAYLQRKHNTERFHVVATYPGYQGLYETLKSIHHINCDFQGWKPRYGTSGWEFKVEDLKSLIKDETKLLIVNFPHNPTGYVPDLKDWQQIIDLCKEKDIFLFSDEMYYFTNIDGSKPLPSGCTQLENAITLFGMSKTYGMPGTRIGWVCSQNSDLIDKMQCLKDYIGQCASTTGEILALIALRNSEKLLGYNIGILKKNLSLWNEFIQRHPDIFDWHPPRASSMGLLKLKGWLLNEIGGGTATGVTKKLAEESKISVVSSSVLGGYDRDGYVRISFAKRNVPEGLERFEEFIKKHHPQK